MRATAVYHPYDPPLKIVNRRFVDAHGRDAKLMGMIGCCMDVEPGWPLGMSEKLTRRASEAGFNWTHANLGPHHKFLMWNRRYITPYPTHDSLDFRPYGGPWLSGGKDDRCDLNKWNPVFWKIIRDWVRMNANLQMYVEIDLIDAWLPKDETATPWYRANNIQGFNHGSNRMFASAPHSHAVRWVRRVVAKTGDFKNVVYQIGNETFTAPVSEAWERGVVNIVRDEEKKRGFIRHLIGSNAYPALKVARWADYESWHGPVVPPKSVRYPRQVNEYNPFVPWRKWVAAYREMEARGDHYAFWLSNSSDANVNSVLREARKIRAEQSG